MWWGCPGTPPGKLACAGEEQWEGVPAGGQSQRMFFKVGRGLSRFIGQGKLEREASGEGAGGRAQQKGLAAGQVGPVKGTWVWGPQMSRGLLRGWRGGAEGVWGVLARSPQQCLAATGTAWGRQQGSPSGTRDREMKLTGHWCWTPPPDCPFLFISLSPRQALSITLSSSPGPRARGRSFQTVPSLTSHGLPG